MNQEPHIGATGECSRPTTMSAKQPIEALIVAPKTAPTTMKASTRLNSRSSARSRNRRRSTNVVISGVIRFPNAPTREGGQTCKITTSTARDPR